MNRLAANRLLLALATAGTVFSGTMSAFRFVEDHCPLDEPCPFFLGYPACYYGFAMFLGIFGSALAYVNASSREPVRRHLILATLGTLFSLNFALEEVASGHIFNSHLGLNTCIWGFIFFSALFCVAYFQWKDVSKAEVSRTVV